MTTTKPLTFGDTFTLPMTEDSVWTIHDIRRRYAHEGVRVAVAEARSTWGSQATYSPDLGWTLGQGCFEGDDRRALREEIEALDVDLRHRTDADWVALYQERLGVETRSHIEEISGEIRYLTEKSTVDHQALRAHVAASAAMEVAGRHANAELYESVYAATLKALNTPRAVHSDED